jgi:hypothetical protein
MRHATWMVIEGSPLALRLYRSYRKLPAALRVPARWIAMPRWEATTAFVRRKARERVLSGPFIGMRLQLSDRSRRNLLGYLLGTQEIELHDVVERIIARGYPTIINVGAADGYYATGFLRRMPQTQVVAFEALPEHHDRLRRTAEANGVIHRLALKGFCRPSDLRNELAAASAPTLVISDIEGGELALLDPERIPALSNVDMLIETHDVYCTGCTDALIARFSATHVVERIAGRPRTAADFPSKALPALCAWMPRTALELMDERRIGRQHWLFLSAKSSNSMPQPSKVTGEGTDVDPQDTRGLKNGSF